MIDKLIEILKTYQDVDYKIVEHGLSRIESYFVKKESEINRCVDSVHTYVTVYKAFSQDGNEYRGSFQTEIHPAATMEEIKSGIAEAVHAAGFVKNKTYPLVNPKELADFTMPLAFSKQNPSQNMYKTLADLKNAVYAEDCHENGYLSYSEFFICQNDIRILNSLDVDVSYRYYSTNFETAVNWKESKEIEVTTAYTMANGKAELLQEHIKELFIIAENKPKAIPTKAIDGINVLLSGECLKEFFSYYYANANASSVYTKMSTFKVGDHLQGDAKGDRIHMTLDPYLAGSTHSCPYDQDGLPLEKVEVISQGKLLQYFGNTRFSSYLGIKPTGSIENFIIDGGTMKRGKMLEKPYLELLSFSDFQMDSVTGDFGSEIRLGFYFDGEKITPVTGGSISGNIKNVQSNMRLSIETIQYDNYVGPKTVLMKDVTIAGA